MEHLNESAKQILLLNDNKRIEDISNSKWIGYPRAKKVLNKLEDLLEHPTILRMPNLLLVGDTNNGKTVLVNRFYTMHRPVINISDSKLVAKVIYVQAPSLPDERKFYNALLERLQVPYNLSDKVEKKQQQVFSVLKRIGTRILIIDEIHHVLAGTSAKQRMFLNVIKYLANELQIVIVAVGIRDAFNAINTDAQLANRFEPELLPKWEMNEEYLRLLASYECMLPLKKPSNLIDTDIALKILSLSEGTIGEISKVLSLASVEAIKSKKEFIDKSIIHKIDYIPPSDRRKYANKLG
jgi:type II secretory pathway predicted ATPase ExeA